MKSRFRVFAGPNGSGKVLFLSIYVIHVIYILKYM